MSEPGSLNRTCLLVVVAFLASICRAEENHSQLGLREGQSSAEFVHSLVGEYCLDCHSGEEPSGNLNLETFDPNLADSDHAWDTSTWETMARRLRARQMPPADAIRPNEDEYQRTVAALERVLDQAAERFPRAGRTEGIRRLTRTEYRNAIRDLLAIEIDVEELLPADQAGHGFDNVNVSGLSPTRLSRYIAAAEEISRLAIGRGGRGPGGATFRVPADRSQETHVDGLPLGTRGGALFDHYFATGGEYEIQLRLARDRDEHVEGLHQPHDIDVFLDRAPLHRFSVRPPSSKRKDEGNYHESHDKIDAHLRTRIVIPAGPHTIGVAFPQQSASLLEIRRQPFDASFNRHRHPRRTPALFELSIAGPFGVEASNAEAASDTPSRQILFGSDDVAKDDGFASNIERGEAILSRLTRRAYRRPIDEDDLAAPMQFFRNGLQAEGFEAGIESAVAAVLVNPHFLLRVERDPAEAKPGDNYQITDTELASRLSFFLWSSLPDEELLGLAEANRLHQPEVLREQTMRMLADPKSQSLVDNFAAQWLYLRNLDSFRPDMRKFPSFDDNLRQAMRRETELLFESVVREDRNVLDLIRTDQAFLNERLAKHYGVRGVQGSRFRLVNLPADSRRGGLLRQGSILAVTSYATRTSPTVRGAWILDNLLGSPPPPPPPNVPALKEKATSANLSVRERLAEHRTNPACASCHDLMDPVGFALENYDAIGRWRDFDDSLPIDAAGAMPDGTAITSVDQMEKQILDRPELFVGAMVEKLLTFSLGRGIESYDGPAVRRIVRSAADNDYRFSSLIVGIVSSTPFQMRAVE